MDRERPNILFFFTDQQRWDTCGCYGQPLPVTPHLDRMAREGVKFEFAFTCQPVCGPARACIQTGKYATEIHVPTNHQRLPPTERTLAQELAKEGYWTGYIGKWHLASCGPVGGPDDFREKPVPPERRGGYRDYWLASDVLEFTSHGYDGHMFDTEGNRRDFPAGRYRADAQTDWVLECLRKIGPRARPRARRRRPFFLFVSYIEPHHQNDHNHYEGPRGSKEKFAGFTPPGDLANLAGDWREEYPDYLGCIHSLDANLGRVRRELRRLDLEKNTLVIFTSDHGSHFRTRNKEYKRSCHDGCIRIPMVLCGPGFCGGNAPQELVSLLDLPPTILAAAGVEPFPAMHGRPLQPVAAGAAVNWREEVFLQISENHCGRAIRTRKWKYSVRAPDADGWRKNESDVYREDFLYDLERDPHEQNNLVSDPAFAPERRMLGDILKRKMAEAREKEPQILPAGG